MGKTYKKIDLIREMEKELKYPRFIHTLQVATTAADLASCHGCDVAKAETAGILHDCAKYLSLDKMIALCEKAGIPLTPFEKQSSALLHSKAGCALASLRYGIEDPEILDAIRYHTTGRPGMAPLEKILFIADYIEPGRNQAPHLEQIRKAAFEDMEEALLMILKDTLSFLGTSDKEIDPMTKMTYNYYINQAAEEDRYG